MNAAWSKPVTNYAGANYGYLSIERMTWVSANTGFARLVTDPDGVTPQSLLDMAARLGVAGDTKYGYGAYPALTLGAAQTNTLRMASAYGAFATGGIRHADTCITQVIAQDGTTLIDNTEVPGEQVLSPEVAGEVTRVLQGVVTPGNRPRVGTAVGPGERRQDGYFPGASRPCGLRLHPAAFLRGLDGRRAGAGDVGSALVQGCLENLHVTCP